MSYAIWLAAAGTVLYILAGYPLLLWASKRTRRAPVAKDAGFEPTVSVILAVYNGGSQLRNKLESLLGLDYPTGQLEIIVVSDGSTDDTDAIANEYRDRRVLALRVPRGGKAA